MMFCPKCGSILMPKTVNEKKVMQCSCGYSSGKLDRSGGRISEKLNTDKKEMPVIDKEIEPMPIIDAQCPRCSYPKAYFWTVQTRASDEPETKFFKCEKCSNVWRDYS